MRHAIFQFTNIDHDAGITAIKGEFNIRRRISACHRPCVVIHLGVNMGSLTEHSPRGVKILDRVDAPTIPIVVVTLENPIDGQIGTGHWIWSHRRINGIPQSLEIFR